MSVYSKIQQLRDERRREWKEKQTKVCQKEIRNTSSYSEKKTEGKGRHYKEERGKKRERMQLKRKRKSRLALTKKHELEKMLVDTARQRRTERHRRWREKMLVDTVRQRKTEGHRGENVSRHCKTKENRKASWRKC